jgi:hypothetical protein
MKIYCQKCGSATDYASQKPKFCSHCAEPFSGGKGATRPPSKALVNKAVQENEEDDFEDSAYILDSLSSLDVEIDMPREIGMKFGEVLGMNAGQSLEDLDRMPDPDSKFSKKQFNEKFKSEAGSLKSKPRKQLKKQTNKNRKTRNNGKSKT